MQMNWIFIVVYLTQVVTGQEFLFQLKRLAVLIVTARRRAKRGEKFFGVPVASWPESEKNATNHE